MKPFFSQRMSLALIVLWSARSGRSESIFQTLPDVINKEWQSHEVMDAVNLSRVGSILNSGFGLSGMDRVQSIRGYLNSRGMHPLLNLVAKPSDTEVSRLGLTSNLLESREYQIRAGNYEVCKSSVKTVDGPNGDFHVLGVIPKTDAVYNMTDDSWMPFVDALGFASSAIHQKGYSIDSLKVTSSSRCLYPVQNSLEPVWKLNIKTSAAPFLMFVGNNGVMEGDLYAFDASATVRAYDTNSSTGTLKDYTITVAGTGYMTNDYFTTADSGTSTAGRQLSSSNTFTGGPTSQYFVEQSTFAHTNSHYDWTTQYGYVWKGPKPLTIKNHHVFSGGNVNNAQYSPFDGQSGPFIMVADGDGSTLQNLGTDTDVVSHEFGHHVIFGSVTTTTGESLVLHEGLADTITFMHAGDACLGESICPAGSSLCQVAGKCLRTGENSLKYNDTAYSAFSGRAHLQGQLVSGFFWDLKKGGGIPVADLNKIVIATITFLPTDANIKSLIVGVLDADFSLFSSKYQSVILAAASARGMSIDTLGISLSSIDGKTPTASTSSSSESSSGGKGFLGLCSVGSGAASNSTAIWVLLGLLIPIVTQLTQKLRPIPVKIRKK